MSILWKSHLYGNRSAVYDLSASNSRKVRCTTAAAAALCIVGAIVFLFSDLGRYPVCWWDESRSAVNALEMSLSGISIVTTYGFAPDLWNTKPPLQIWLMALTLRVIPDAEIALRMPSALAALGTVVLTACFARRGARSPFAALLAGVLLITSPGFYGTHVSRTGDYDSLLVLFTTAYLYLLFLFVHRAKATISAAVLLGLCVAGAVLAKGIAGLVPGIGVVVYLAWFRRWRRILNQPAYLIGACVAVVPVFAFYAMREAVTPGFIDAVFSNEFGRYVVDVEPPSNDMEGLLYYLQLITPWRTFAFGPLLMLVVPVGWFFAKPRLRIAINYAVIIAAIFVAIISFSKTRYLWYYAPAYPWLAIASAISIYSGIVALRERRQRLPNGLSRIAFWSVVVGMIILVACAVVHRHVLSVKSRDAEESSYGPLFGDLLKGGFSTFTVVDPGRSDQGPVMDRKNGHYNPILRFYGLLHEARSGASISVMYELPEHLAAGEVLASCSPKVDLTRLEGARLIAQVRGCSAILLGAPSDEEPASSDGNAELLIGRGNDARKAQKGDSLR